MNPLHLTPTELANKTGKKRREVIAACMDLGVPIYNGRINADDFADAVKKKGDHLGPWWDYDSLTAVDGDWSPATRGDRPWDGIDYHIDLGCGRVPKARLGIDLRPSPGATRLAIDLDTLRPSDGRPGYTEEQCQVIYETWDQYQGHSPVGLPFPDESIQSIISHHALEHIGGGFERLMEECYRVLKFDGVMRVIVPLFPSRAAVQEYDHKRWFMEGTFQGFCNHPGGTNSTDGFSEPYNTCKFKLVDEDMTPPVEVEDRWGPDDIRELRVTLWKWSGDEPEDPDPLEYPIIGGLRG